MGAGNRRRHIEGSDMHRYGYDRRRSRGLSAQRTSFESLIRRDSATALLSQGADRGCL